MLSRAFAFVTTIHLVRTLQAGNFGVIVFAMTVLAYAELLVNAGFSHLGPREVARDGSRVPTLVRAILTIRLLLAVVALGLLAAFVWLLPGPPTTKQVTLLYGLSLFVTAVDLAWVFLGLESMRFVALAEIVAQAIIAGGVLLLVRDAAHTVRVPLIYLAAETASAALLVCFYTRRFGCLHLGIDLSVWRPLIVAALPLAASSAMGMITFNFDTLLVGLTLGTRPAGLYGAAYRVSYVPSLVAVAYFTALSPSLARAYTEGLGSVANLLNKSIRLTAAIGLGIGVSGTLLAVPGFNLLYGPGFHDSILPFQVLIWSIAILFINRNYRTLLIAFNQQRVELRVMTAAAATNVALNLAFIRLFGLPGAALATVASEFVILVFGYTYTRQLVGHVPLGRHLPKIALAAAAMGAVLLLSEPLHLFVRIALGAATYAVALPALRAITVQEVRFVFSAWKPIEPKPIPAEGQLGLGE